MTLPLPSSPHWPPTRMMTKGLFGTRFGPPRLQVVEAGVVAAELELDGSGRAIAMLGDVNLGDAWFFVKFIVFCPIKKHYNITVLFQGTAFPQVAQDRPLVGPLFRRATQLRNRNHGNS